MTEKTFYARYICRCDALTPSLKNRQAGVNSGRGMTSMEISEWSSFHKPGHNQIQDKEKRMNRNRYTVILALVLCLALAVTAFAFDAIEATDYPGGVNFTFNPNVGTLDPGANTVSGSLNGFCLTEPIYGRSCNPATAAGGDTQDSPLFTVPVGYQVSSLTVTTSAVSGPTGFTATMSVDAPKIPPPGLVSVIPTTFLVLNGTTANLVATPIGAGTYALSVFGQNASADGAFSLNWSVSMNLAPVVVSPVVAVTNLINMIADPYSGLVLTNGQKSSLTDKLNNVLGSVQAGQNKQATNQLQAFINSVETYLKSGKISDQTATTLTVAANAIITSLQ